MRLNVSPYTKMNAAFSVVVFVPPPPVVVAIVVLVLVLVFGLVLGLAVLGLVNFCYSYVWFLFVPESLGLFF